MRLSLRTVCIAVAASLLATGGAAGAGGGGGGDDLPACRSKGQVKSLGKGWIRLRPFQPANAEEGPRRIVDLAATPSAPNRVYTTNGVVVKLSADGGCTWNLVAEGSSIQVPGGQHDTDVFTAITAPSDDRLWAVGYDDVSGVPSPRVHVYDNLGPGATGDPKEQQPTNGLPAVGKPVELLSSTVNPAENYLLVEEPADPANGRPEATRRLYATYVPENPPELGIALGLTWKHVPTPPAFGSIDGIALGAPGGLWIWSGTQATFSAAASADASRWAPPLPAQGAVTAVDTNIRGETLVASEADQGGAVGRVVDAKGRVLGRSGLPAVATSMTHGRLRADTRVVSGQRGTFGYDARRRSWINITPPGVGPLRGLTMAKGLTAGIVLGHGDDAFYRFDTFDGEGFVPSQETYKPIGPGGPYTRYSEPHFADPTITVTVEPEKTVDVADALRVPANVNKLDVFFLVDTTGSMQPTIDALRRDVYSVAEQLRRRLGQQACFGVGDVKDVAPTDPLNVYRTRMKIGCEADPAMPKMKQALDQLRSFGGGPTPPEAQTIALEQMMTGKGSTSPFVPPDQDAEFRRDAFKVVVLLTDAPFNQGPGYPPVDDVAALLKGSEVRVVNVLVRTNLDPADAYVDMARLAVGTDSLAPPGGVDCDNDGRIGPGDARPGDPIVCESDGSNPTIGPLVVTLLLGVPDPGTVTVDVADPHDVVREPVRTPLSVVINLKRDVDLPFALPMSCTRAQDGADLPVDLSATVRALPVDAAARIVVRCRSVALRPPGERVIPVRPPQPPAEPPEVVVEPFRPPPRPPVALALLPPLVNPPAPVSNMNLNAGFSQQEEEQFQVAGVTQDASDAEENAEAELAMSALDHEPGAAPTAAFLTGAAVLSAAAAAAHRRRLQRSGRTCSAR